MTETMKEHRQRGLTHYRVYYTGDERPMVAAEPDKATWITIETSRYGDEAAMDFRYPGEMGLVLKVEKMLRIAYAKGAEAAREEMRKAIGIIE